MSKTFVGLLTSLFSAFSFAATAVRVSPKTALEGVNSKKAIVIDVREADEVAHGKVQDAHVFPTSKVGSPAWDQFVSSLPKDKEIYTYCAVGGRADTVAEALRAKGFKASSTGGYKDWIKAGAKSN